MRRWVRPLLILALLVAAPLPAWSIIIETRDGQFHKGRVVSQDTLRIVLKEANRGTNVTISRSDIVRTIEAVQPAKLKALKLSAPQTYFDYAKELAAQRDDPEAHDMALRLFLISAYLQPEKFGYQALDQMSRLARTKEEARTFRAMAFLMDFLADTRTLVADKKPPVVSAESAGDFLRTLELLRRGKTKEALDAGQKPGVANFFDLVPDLMNYKDFVKLCQTHPECVSCKNGRVFCKRCQGAKDFANCKDCNGKGWIVCPKCKGEPRRVPLTAAQLEIILRLELLHTQNPKAKLELPSQGASEGWSRLLVAKHMRPVPVLSLPYLTEFDPRLCVYANGKWVAPPK